MTGGMRVATAVAVGAVLTLTGCTSASNSPDTASQPTEVPGPSLRLGEASAHGISVQGLSVRRDGNALILSGRIVNGEKTADELLRVSSQVSETLTLHPPASVAPGAALTLGPGGTPAVLRENARLEEGGTVSLVFAFKQAGDVQVFSSFS